MSFKALHSLRKEEIVENKKLYKRHVVIGSDAFAINMYRDLKNIHGNENVGLLVDHDLNKDSVRPIGPSLLRGESNARYLQEKHANVCGEVFETESKFFKELKWRAFSGRSKPEKLMFCEEYFVEKRLDIKEEELFPFMVEENFFSKLNEERLNFKLTGIIKSEPLDLVDPAHFALSCSNGTVIECEHLYWSAGPQEFLEMYQDKNHLSDDFLEFCESTRTPSALYVELEYENKITDMEETLFIPLSYTHEWGHFIGEFKMLENGKQRGEFVTFLDKDHSNEEMIAKKIRILKKNLEKIFPETRKMITEDFIKLSDSSPCPKVDDEQFAKVKDEFSGLHFFSYNAPLEMSEMGHDLSFLSRAVASIDSIEAQIS